MSIVLSARRVSHFAVGGILFMATDKKKVIVYADWILKFEVLDDPEAGRLIKHFFRYINDLNPEYPDRITELSFIDIQNTLKEPIIVGKMEKAEGDLKTQKNP